MINICLLGTNLGEDEFRDEEWLVQVRYLQLEHGLVGVLQFSSSNSTSRLFAHS